MNHIKFQKNRVEIEETLRRKKNLLHKDQKTLGLLSLNMFRLKWRNKLLTFKIDMSNDIRGNLWNLEKRNLTFTTVFP